jgi:hypothetical protein
MSKADQDHCYCLDMVCSLKTHGLEAGIEKWWNLQEVRPSGRLISGMTLRRD